MKTAKKILLILLPAFLLGGCVFVAMPGLTPLVQKKIGGEGADKILVIDISGIIKDDKRNGILGTETTRPITARIAEELDMAAKDKMVKAVVLKINSPGGTVTACDIIYHEIREFKKERKLPVVAAMLGVAASGGYYIAAASDRIVAHPTTVTGSIGVVAYGANASGLLKKIGITDQTIKSGDKKDIGSPLRTMTAEEKKILQSVIDGLYDRFLDVVVEGRPEFSKISREGLKKIADGRIYTAEQALALKLVDEIGYLDDAISSAKKMAGIEKATLITYAPARSYRNNIYSSAPVRLPPVVNLVNIDAGFLNSRFGMSFMYIWMP